MATELYMNFCIITHLTWGPVISMRNEGKHVRRRARQRVFFAHMCAW